MTTHINKLGYIFSKDCECDDILKNTLAKTKDEVVSELIKSGLRGRGGAGFPIGLKWKFTASQPEEVKYIICNADEGEPGTFKDREILTQVPKKVLRGMALCAYVTGAKKGFIYLRGEYKYLVPHLQKNIDEFHEDMKKFNIETSLP